MSRRGESQLRVELASLIRKLRDAGELTQEELAQRCGLNLTTVVNAESGRTSPSLESLERLAAGLNMSLSELIARAEKKGPDQELDDLIATMRACAIAPRFVRRLVVAFDRIGKVWPALRHFIEREAGDDPNRPGARTESDEEAR